MFLKDPRIFCLQEIHLTGKDTHRLKVKGWKRYHENENQKQAGIFLSDKAVLK
jgi:hypothetical protein